MSIKLMSAIFETEMRDLEYVKNGEQRKTKASTAKLVLLAIADHANDFGESSYPGYEKLEIKTALSRQGLVDTLEALKYNGLLIVDSRGSRLGTNNYTVNIRSFSPMYKEIEAIPEVVKPLDKQESSHLTGGSQATRHESSVNHQLTAGSNCFSLYESNIGPITTMIANSLEDAEKTYPIEWIADAIRLAVENNKRNWRYCEAILKRWQANGKDDGKGKPQPQEVTRPEYKPFVPEKDGNYVPNPYKSRLPKAASNPGA